MLLLKNDFQILEKNGFHKMTSFKNWINASRPRTLPLSISGILVGSSYAYFLGSFDLFIFLMIVATAISFQILSNFANDYGDGLKGTDNKNRIGPKRTLQMGLISPKQMRHAIIANVLISSTLSLSLIGFVFGMENIKFSFVYILLSFFSIYAAIRYTVGDKAYGYRAMGDLVVFLFFGLLSVFGTFFLFTKQIDIRLLLPASAIGFLSSAVLNLNNMRDIESDRDSKKITLAGVMGQKKSKIYHFIIVILGIFFMMTFHLTVSFSKLILISWIAFFPFIFHLKGIYKITNPKLFDPHLKLVSISTFVLSLLIASVMVIEHSFLQY